MKRVLTMSLFALVGCQHGPPTVFVREVPVQMTTTNHLDVIRFPSTYRSYSVGRRPDSGNSTVMHEAHILYVRERPDRWNLQPPPAPTGPKIDEPSSADPTFVPLPMSDQLRLEVQKQQKISESLAEQTKRFQQTAEMLAPAARKAVELATQIQQNQLAIQERLRRLEELDRPANFTNWPSVSSTND